MNMLLQLGELYLLLMGNTEEARRWLIASVEMCTKVGDILTEARARQVLTVRTRKNTYVSAVSIVACQKLAPVSVFLLFCMVPSRIILRGRITRHGNHGNRKARKRERGPFCEVLDCFLSFEAPSVADFDVLCSCGIWVLFFCCVGYLSVSRRCIREQESTKKPRKRKSSALHCYRSSNGGERTRK